MSDSLTPAAMRELVDDLAKQIAKEVGTLLSATITAQATRKRSRREIAGELVEALGADAIVVLWSRHKNGKTLASKITSGNSLTCSGLVDWAWDAQQEKEEDDAEEDDE